MRFRSTLARVRGLGAARSGTEQWWQERVTAAASIPLTIFLIWLGGKVAGRSYAETIEILGHPLVAIGLIIALSNMFWHMKLGMQAIIEDYVHGGSRVWLLLANNFSVAVFWVAGIYAVIRLGLGAS
ncbi:MAG TPA: succinate dehydrogenase, hydrophobic membrane anchor protein [Aestuariivirgaceae bacterium]|jgi:succinate dehydrogenase / fumarate reductase membrane anchor subunit